MIMFNREAVDKKKEEFQKLVAERFTLSLGQQFEPVIADMGAICSRCGDRYGNHYTPGFELFCPDEWVAAGHQLA